MVQLSTTEPRTGLMCCGWWGGAGSAMEALRGGFPDGEILVQADVLAVVVADAGACRGQGARGDGRVRAPRLRRLRVTRTLLFCERRSCVHLRADGPPRP